MKHFTTPTRREQPRDNSGRFTTESALIQQWDAERIARAERAERNRQAEEQYGLTPGDLIFA